MTLPAVLSECLAQAVMELGGAAVSAVFTFTDISRVSTCGKLGVRW